jgi:TIR domain-containing protein
MNPEMPNIFLSYARVDKDFALKLAHDLRSAGTSLWVDELDISPGARWDNAVEDALRTSQSLLVILSPASVASQNVMDEVAFALEHKRRIFPVVYRVCEVPFRLKRFQYIDFTAGYNAGLSQLLNALNKSSSEPSPLPSPNRIDETPPVPSPPLSGTVETLIGRLLRWLSERPAYLLGLGMPPLLFATWRLFRLPVPADTALTLIFMVTGVVCGLALVIKSRGGAILAAMLIGLAFVIKPALVPFQGFVGDAPFPYSSATAMTYWLPGVLFIIFAAAVGLTAPWSRLLQDLKRFHPDVAVLFIAAATGLAGYFYFSRPTLYDVYLPFRPQYALLREHLVSVAAAVDQVARPFPPSKSLDVPLILDERGHIRNEDPSTSGHLFLYQHLTKPDAYFGDIEYALSSDLHLHLRDTGNEPVLSSSVFTEFASTFDTDGANSLARTINAPYLVIVKPLTLEPAGRVDSRDLRRAAPYRVFLYNLKRDEIIFAADIPNSIGTTEELKEQVNRVLEMSVGAKILRPPLGSR